MTLDQRSAVIFDFDGVLADSQAPITGAIDHALRVHGWPTPPPSELRRFIGPPTFAAFSELTGQAVDSAAVAAAVTTYRERYGAVFLSETRLFDGIAEMLDRVGEGRVLAVATSKSAIFAEPLLRALRIRGHFAAIAAPGPEERATDKASLVGQVLRDLRPAHAVMVGDRRFDVEAAHDRGLAAVGVTWGIGSVEELRAAGADAVVHRPSDLLAALVALGG